MSEPSRFVRVVDTETTSLEPADGRIVEIAKVDWIDGVLTDPVSDLVDPGCEIPALAKAVHHITEKHVAGKPTLSAVIAKYAGAEIAAAHKADFDRGFLGPTFAKHWVCTYKVSLRVWPDLPSHSNQFLRYHLGLPDPAASLGANVVLLPHRALFDAMVTAHLFGELIKHMTVREMVQISREPALLSVLTFGKHRGTKLAEAPRDYLEWLLKNHDDESVKFSVRRVLGVAA